MWPEDFVAICISCLEALTLYKISQSLFKWTGLYIFKFSVFQRTPSLFCFIFTWKKNQLDLNYLSIQRQHYNFVTWLSEFWHPPSREEQSVVFHLIVCSCRYAKSPNLIKNFLLLIGTACDSPAFLAGRWAQKNDSRFGLLDSPRCQSPDHFQLYADCVLGQGVLPPSPCTPTPHNPRLLRHFACCSYIRI